MPNLFIKAVGGLLYVFVAISALIFLSAWTFQLLASLDISHCLYDLDIGDLPLSRKTRCESPGKANKTSEKERSQKVLRLLVNLAFSAAIVISALDHRFAWSAVPLQIIFIGDALVLLGLLIIFLVFKENTFTAQTVEVEAGQKVTSTGPCALVRHSM